MRRRFAICELSTPNASFEEDLAAYRGAGADGISICELKLARLGRKSFVELEMSSSTEGRAA